MKKEIELTKKLTMTNSIVKVMTEEKHGPHKIRKRSKDKETAYRKHYSDDIYKQNRYTEGTDKNK